MLEPATEIQDLSDLRKFVYATLCDQNELVIGTFQMSERILVRSGKPCGIYFCVHGPRSVKLIAIWETEQNSVLFYGSSGERKLKVRVRREGLTVRAPARYLAGEPATGSRPIPPAVQALGAVSDATDIPLRVSTLFLDASAAVYRGEKAGLVGPNGSGKTTIFRMIMREEYPDEGQVSVDRGTSTVVCDIAQSAA